MPSFELEPIEGGPRVKLSGEKITIGRGPFLQVTDKRVSRNHATLEVTDGQLILTPIHTNPCFFKPQGKGDKTNLRKDVAKVLNHADTFGLLPDKLFYRVIVKGLENGKKSRETKRETETKNTKAGRVKMKAGNSREDMTLPVGKSRVLPGWMKGASKRVTMDMPQRKPTTPVKRQTATNVRTPKRKPAKTEAYESPSPRKRGATRRKAREPSDSEEMEEDYSEEEVKPGRRAGRKASQVTKYTDDFVLSDEEIKFSDEESSDHKKRGHHKGSSDEDFEVSEESSASDWEEEKSKKASRSAKSSKKGAGRRGRRSSGGATRRSSRTSSKRRKRYAESDSDDFDDDFDDEDNYVPRPTKRRGGKKVEESEEEDDKPRGGQKKKAKREPRPSCMYGRKCYRKNPNHFTEFCHPGDASYDEEEAAESKAEYKSDASSPEEESEKPPVKKKELREKDKKSVLHKASDDDGEPNTYDYDDSFMEDTRKRRSSEGEDSGELSESEEEDVKRLVKEARGFLRNKKAQKV